jgi:hypothetical protein
MNSDFGGIPFQRFRRDRRTGDLSLQAHYFTFLHYTGTKPAEHPCGEGRIIRGLKTCAFERNNPLPE